MSKAVLMALSPYWYSLIGEGFKTEEVRKTIPKALDWNKQVECYMTKDEKSFKRIPKALQEKYRAHIGKVGMRFTCDEIHTRPANTIYLSDAQQYYLGLLTLACLTEIEAIDYMGGQLNRDMHFLHISDLVIYDKPRELGEFSTTGLCFNIHNLECTTDIWGNYHFHYSQNSLCRVCKYLDDLGNCRKTSHSLTRPPQSWCYVEEA